MFTLYHCSSCGEFTAGILQYSPIPCEYCSCETYVWYDYILTSAE